MSQPPIRPEQRLWRWYRSLYPISQLGLGCLTLLIMLFGCAFCTGGLPSLVRGIQQGYEQNQPPPIATETSTPGPEWTITHTFAGTGTSKTATFAVNGNWQLNWYCTLPSSGMIQANISIDIDRPGQKVPLVPYAVDASCSTNGFSGSTEEHQTGTLYLAVTADTQWTVDVEELL